MIPNVIFNLRFFEYYGPKSKVPDSNIYRKIGNFVRCKTAYNLIDYITRDKAISTDNIETIRTIEALSEYTELVERDILNYANNRPGSTGGFNAKGDLTNENINEIKDELRNTQSIVWTGIISFEEEYGKKNCKNKKAAQDLLKTTLKSLFKESHLKYENINWFASMHNNTENYHIHLCFWEKEPIYTAKQGDKLYYSKKGSIKLAALDNFKFAIAKHFEIAKIESFTLRDEMRNSLSIDIRNNYNYHNELIDISKKIEKEGTYIFGKLSNELKSKIKSFVNYTIQNNINLKQLKDKYLNDLLKTQKQYIDICIQNQIEINENIKNYANSRIQELYIKLGNDVCKTAKSINTKQLNSKGNDIAQIAQTNKLIAYDNKKERLEINKEDNLLIKKILKSKLSKDFESLMNKKWTNLKWSEDKSLKNYHYQSYRLIRILSKFTKDIEHIERIYKSSSLYRPDIWNKKYDNEIDWMKGFKSSGINVFGKKYSETLMNVAQFETLEKAKIYKKHPKDYARVLLLVSRTSANQLRSIIITAYNSLTLNFDNTFNDHIRALNEQKIKKQKERELEQQES